MMKRSKAGVVAGLSARVSQRAVLAAAAGLAVAAGAHGANIIWIGGATGEYQTPTNWAGDALPGFSDTIIMNTSPTMAVDFTADVSIGRVLHSEGDLIFTLNGHTIDLRLPNGVTSSWSSGINVAEGGTATIVGGRVLCNWADISRDFGDHSTVLLADPDAVFESRQSIRVGSFSDGVMAASNGATIIVGNDLVIGNVAQGNGLMTLVDAGTTVQVVDQVQVGALGDGILRVNTGGVLTCENFFVSAFTSSVGQVFVAGDGAAISAVGGLSVGFEHTGDLEVNAGGSVSAFQLRVGFNAQSVGTLFVQGTGAELIIGADAVVGSSGNGELVVRTGGFAQLGELNISGSVNQAIVRVQGAASSMGITDETRIGTIGTGIMEISQGAIVSGDTVEIGGGGLLSLDDGTFTCMSMDINGLGVGARAAARGAEPAVGLIGEGTVGGDVTLRGSMTPGPNFATITIGGGLVIEENGLLDLDFTAPAAGLTQTDSLAVSGDVTLGGVLRMTSTVSTVNPPLLRRIPVITGAMSVSGSFDDAEIEQPGLGSLRFIIVSNGTDVEVVATVVGDVTGDAVVESSDLATLLAAWGTTDHNADFNNDGIVDAGDLATLLAAWG